jgi:serine/threonine-protein kinase
MLGPYEILAPLGSGGMGEVYRARDTRLGREVAIKTLPRDMADDPDRLSRFEKEARMASALNHPNIITIHDIGEWNSIHYIAMELVDGKTIRQLLADGPLPADVLLSVATQIADGLAKAHEAGIVHRDLKPENVMVTSDRFAKILDFGLSKHQVPSAATSDSSTMLQSQAMTNPGTVLGTVAYMSPEQALGKDIDFRSDHFSFGSLLYEMATQKRAFHRESAVQTMSAIIEQTPAPLTALNPLAPDMLRGIVDRCLAKDPSQRYISTRDLVADLRELAASMSLERVRSRTTIGRAAAPKPRTLRMVLYGLLALVLILPLGAISFPAFRELVLSRFGTGAALPQQKNLAILPFQAAGGNEQDLAFADGLTEALTAKLTQLTTSRSLQVAPAAEVRTRKVDSVHDARIFFGSNLVLTGNVQRQGQKVSLVWNVIDAASERPLRTRSITVDSSDASAMQERTFDSIVDTLRLELTPADRQTLTALDTRVPAARELYLQARGYLQDYDRPENIDRAISVLGQAVILDSKYAVAYTGLGEAHWRKYDRLRQPESIELGQKACAQALQLNETLAAAHGCLATFYGGTGRYEDAVKELHRALEIEPTNDGFLRELARAQERLGKIDDAEKTLRQAINSRPHYWASYNLLGALYFNRGRYSDAVEMFKQVVSLAPDSQFGYGNLGGAYVHLGRYSDAIPILERAVAIRPNASAHSNLATAYFDRREFMPAVEGFKKAAKLDEKNHVIWGNLGDAYYWAPGQRALSADAYKKAIALGEDKLKVNSRDAVLLGQLAVYHAMLGEREPAMNHLQRALQIAPQSALVRFSGAVVHNQFNDTDETLKWLEQAAQNGFSVTTIRDFPNFDRLWAFPKFQSLLRDH